MRSFSAMEKIFSEKLENWSIFSLKKDFFPFAMCDYFLCNVLCMEESLCVFLNRQMPRQAFAKLFERSLIDSTPSRWKSLPKENGKVLQTLNYSFGLFMKLSPFWMGQISLPPLFLLRLFAVCMNRWCEGGKSMKKKQFFLAASVTYVKTGCPRKSQVFAKKEKQFLIRTLSFSRVLRSHTPFYCLLDFHSSPSQNHHPHSSRAKTSGKIVERKTKEKKFFGLLRYRFMSAAVGRKAWKRRVDVYVDKSGRRNRQIASIFCKASGTFQTPSSFRASAKWGFSHQSANFTSTTISRKTFIVVAYSSLRALKIPLFLGHKDQYSELRKNVHRTAFLLIGKKAFQSFYQHSRREKHGENEV